MKTNLEESKDRRFPYSGQLEIEIYFREYRDNCANDCRRFLHKGRNGKTPLIEKLKEMLNDEEKEKLIIIPKDYALLRFVPEYLSSEDISMSKRKGAGRTRGGIEIYDVAVLEKGVLDQLRNVLDEKKKELPWFNFYRIYFREELL
jgi:hypothetical protein